MLLPLVTVFVGIFLVWVVSGHAGTLEKASSLTSRLSQSFSLYEDWFDPFIGVRGRYNFYKPFYLTAEGDVGGFGIGSEGYLSGLCRNRVPNHSEHLFGDWLSFLYAD